MTDLNYEKVSTRVKSIINRLFVYRLTNVYLLVSNVKVLKAV